MALILKKFCNKIFQLKDRLKKFKTLVILLFWCTIIYILLLCISWFCIEKPNEFGDTAGWINGLFSALAFAGVVYAIFMQRDELELQREELKETRKELSAQKEEFKTQNDTLKRQRFENTFFNMLQLQQQIVEGITYTYNISVINEDSSFDNSLPYYKTITETVKGREVFAVIFEDIKGNGDVDKITGMRTTLKKKGLKGYEENYSPSYFDHYFRNLYRILKFVDTSPLIEEDTDRYDYAAMVRAQLSRYELIWLYYNGLSEYGKDKFKPLIEDYAILKNLRQELLVKDLDLEISYKPEAFDSNLAKQKSHATIQ